MIPCIQYRIHFVLSSVEATFKSKSWSTEQQYCQSLRTLQLIQKPQRTIRKRGKKTMFYTKPVYFQYYIFISQVFCSPGYLLMLWSNNSVLIVCMDCSFIPWLLTLFFQGFWFGFFPKFLWGGSNQCPDPQHSKPFCTSVNQPWTLCCCSFSLWQYRIKRILPNSDRWGAQ